VYSLDGWIFACSQSRWDQAPDVLSKKALIPATYWFYKGMRKLRRVNKPVLYAAVPAAVVAFAGLGWFFWHRRQARLT
jgi:hypothetical protein